MKFLLSFFFFVVLICLRTNVDVVKNDVAPFEVLRFLQDERHWQHPAAAAAAAGVKLVEEAAIVIEDNVDTRRTCTSTYTNAIRSLLIARLKPI